MKYIFKNTFSLLREQFEKIVSYEEEVKQLKERFGKVYSDDYLKKVLKDATVKHLNGTTERVEKICSNLDSIKDKLLSVELDLNDVALSNALAAINATKGKLTDEQVRQMADNFRGNLPALKLIQSAVPDAVKDADEFMENGTASSIFKDYIIDPETEFGGIKQMLLSAVEMFQYKQKTLPDIKDVILHAGGKLRRLAEIVGADLKPEDMAIIADEHEYFFLRGMEEVKSEAQGIG